MWQTEGMNIDADLIRDADGQLEELTLKDDQNEVIAHIERMDDDEWYVSFNHSDGYVRLTFTGGKCEIETSQDFLET